MKKTLKRPSSKTVQLYIVTALTILLSRNIFSGQIAFGLFVAGSFCGVPWIVALIYVASGFLYGLNFALIRVVQATVVVLAFLMHKKLFKKMISKLVLAFYMLLANIIFCTYQYDGFDWLLNQLVCLLAGIAFAYVSIFTFKALFTRGLSYKPTFDEIISIALFAVVMGYSLATFTFWQYNLLMFVAPFAILFLLCAFGDKTGLVGAILFSLAGLFAESSFKLFAVYILMSLSALTFNKINRFAAGFSLIITNVLLAYFFEVYGVFDIFILLPTIFSVVAFFCVPKKTLKKLSDFFGTNQQYTGKSVVNRLRNNLAYKLYGLSDVFFSMKNTFVSMTSGGISKEECKTSVVKEVAQTVCNDCKNRSICWRQNLKRTEESLLQLTECAISSGSVSILDVDGLLTMGCDRLGIVLSTINNLAETYGNYISRVAETDNNRLLISEQLGGVSQLMNQLASECKSKITFDATKENEIVDKLTFHNCLCNEAMFIEQGQNIMVILSVAKKDLDSAVICSVVGNVLKCSMRVTKIEPSESENFMTVYLAKKSRFHLTYGIRNITKFDSAVSGDTHSFVKIDNNKVLLAICDGMGSGENANKMSDTAISLVENFYRAGFDSEVILSCTNKLLSSFNTEVFTAVDICVVDLSNGLCDFIKLGASDGLVRTSGQVQFVSGSSLPLGVLEEMRPSITKSVVKAGDYVLICSDGFWECFEDPNQVAHLLHTTNCTNPQTLADEFMTKALDNCKNKPSDDMTLMIARVA